MSRAIAAALFALMLLSLGMTHRCAIAAPLEMCAGAAAEVRGQADDTEKVLKTIRAMDPAEMRVLASPRINAAVSRMIERRSRLIADLAAYAADQREVAAALEACPR